MSFQRSTNFAPNPNTARGSATKLGAHKNRIVYANGKTIIIRDLADPFKSVAYTGHIQPTTAAKISPTGYYVASADVGGTVRVWDLVGEDNTLKGEYRVLSGKVNDLEWDGESKRIIAVGDGKEKFGHAFMFDTGSSTGEISGHSKSINAVAIRHQRPFRAATAADDSTIVFHTGAPYKYEKTIKTHTKFVQDVRYAPSGDLFGSVGSDYKFFLYDGKTGETVAEVTDSPHSGSIFGLGWSPNSQQIVTSSADATVKLWDVETKKAVTAWTVGSGVQHHQVGNVWSGDAEFVSLSLSGDLNVFDTRQAQSPSRVFTAPQKSINVGTVIQQSTFIAGTADGRIYAFETASGQSSSVAGESHTNFVSGLAAEGNIIYSTGYDDKVREISEGAKEFTRALVSTSSQPKGVAVSEDGTVFVPEVSSVEVFKSNQKLFELPTKYAPQSIAASKAVVAIGGDDQKVHLYDWDGKALKDSSVLEGPKGVVSAVAFSPDGMLLAAGDSSGKITLFNVPEKKVVTGRWSFHSARINSLSWTSDSRHCASGSLDTHVYIWSVEKPLKNIAIKNAGPGGVNTVAWIGGGAGKTGKLVSSGFDPSVRVWEVTFHL